MKYDKINYNVQQDINAEIMKARVTFVFRGYGDLTLTDKMLYWNKSATSFLAFGLFNAATDDHVNIYLEDIAKVETYKYVTGGLKLTTVTGQEYKFGFKHKKDFKKFYEYLLEIK